MSQHRQLKIGSPHTPIIDEREFTIILSQFPSWARLLAKKDSVRCSCWDAITENRDPYCSICNDGWIYGNADDRPIQCIMEAFPPHGRSGNADFVSEAGRLQRYDYLMYTYGYEWGKIVVGDTIIWPIDAPQQQIEFDVANVVPYFGTSNRVIYIACMLWKKDISQNITYPSTPQL